MSRQKKQPAKGLKAISLFSGAGGMDVGFGMTGVKILAANDSWDVAMKTYKNNLRGGHSVDVLVGSIEKHQDHIIQLGKKHGTDVVFGGPPCQDFSSAGWRTGNGYNASMTDRFVSVALKIRPEWVIMENVNTIMSIGAKHIEYVTEMLKKAGYSVAMTILNAVDFGVPQYRKRFFLFARNGKDHDMCALDKSIERERERERELVYVDTALK